MVDGVYSFSRSTPGDSLTIPPQTPFIPSDLTDRPNELVILWAGRNNLNAANDPVFLHDCSLDIEQLIAEAMTALVPLKKRAIILGITTANHRDEYIGSANYNAKRTLASRLAARYPLSFIDIDQILNQSGKNEGQDLIDKNNGVIPASLRADRTHLNDRGYRIVANSIYLRIIANQW